MTEVHPLRCFCVARCQIALNGHLIRAGGTHMPAEHGQTGGQKTDAGLGVKENPILPVLRPLSGNDGGDAVQIENNNQNGQNRAAEQHKGLDHIGQYHAAQPAEGRVGDGDHAHDEADPPGGFHRPSHNRHDHLIRQHVNDHRHPDQTHDQEIDRGQQTIFQSQPELQQFVGAGNF